MYRLKEGGGYFRVNGAVSRLCSVGVEKQGEFTAKPFDGSDYAPGALPL